MGALCLTDKYDDDDDDDDDDECDLLTQLSVLYQTIGLTTAHQSVFGILENYVFAPLDGARPAPPAPSVYAKLC